MGVNSISFGSPHVCAMGRTCGEPNEIKKNTHPKYITALFREQTSLFRNADVLEVSCSEANRCNDDPLLYTTLNRHVKREREHLIHTPDWKKHLFHTSLPLFILFHT